MFLVGGFIFVFDPRNSLDKNRFIYLPDPPNHSPWRYQNSLVLTSYDFRTIDLGWFVGERCSNVVDLRQERLKKEMEELLGFDLQSLLGGSSQDLQVVSNPHL